ncbi:MAG: glutamine-synthetase adenylyltransferase [Bryobacteraceae bacterium]|jgi:glutamate-ammonia-ligase adenylyltransferase
MQRLLQLQFEDRTRAEREIAELSEHLAPAGIRDLDRLLAAGPAPEQGLQYFARLREREPKAFRRLTQSAAGLRYLAAIFTHSNFLSEEVLEHPEWAEELASAGDLHRVLEADELRARLEASLAAGVPSPLDLARFRRKAILRIAVRDVLGLGTLPEITAELSALADAIVEIAYGRIRKDLISRFGVPQSKNGEAYFAVIALGKLGGEELNYSSDIDLLFLYSANGETTGPERITTKEFFKRAANELTTLLSTYTAEGFCYRVDLRLRPDGKLGEVCISLEGARKYYETRARDWELQMLIKARVAAGDRATGRALLDFVEPRIYSTTLDFSAIEELSATRERLNEKLTTSKRRGGTRMREVRKREIDIKLERGGIRDIEFLVQCLQRLYGGMEPWVRHGGTLLALGRLQDKGFLSSAEYGRLASAYQFLRHLEHRLQFADDRQTHRLPSNRAALELVARRMPAGGGSAEWLLEETRTHFERVIEIYERVVHSRAIQDATETQPSRPQSNVVRVLELNAPSFYATLARSGLRRGYTAFEHFLERISGEPALLERLNSNPTTAFEMLDLFEHSPYFAEELIRTPELLEEIGRRPGEEPPPSEVNELRRWFRRQMVRIQAESICLAHPIFETLVRTSELADSVIATAYEIARGEVLSAHPPEDPGYEPAGQMWVIALGRLGMREFDLASDADFVFVLADSDATEMRFWTRVAERLIDLLTAYTGGGILLAVDTRLRPNGRGGPLVQSESALTDYFAGAAETWEGITYMKSRTVAGDAARAEGFLHHLQEVDWRRYGQSGRSRTDLRQMRLRLEKEQGALHPLKAGRGGYYDIDFLLMYLRLKSAGIFFKVLNTPARIEVLESMGHLDRAEAKFLDEAATFYRALDHSLRVYSGHAEGKLPSSEAQLETIGALLRRWSPIPLEDLPDVQAKTRALFDRLFS